MTKDTGNLRQFRSVACGEYTLPRDDPAFLTIRMDSRKCENWNLYWKSRPVSSTSSMELKFELSP